MKVSGKLAAIVLLLTSVISCQKEKSIENGGFTPGGNARWEFTESGVVFKGDMDSAQIIPAGTLQTLILEGATADGTGGFYITITDAAITTGTYKSPQAFFQYSINGTAFYEIDPTNPDQFSVTITSIDGSTVTGTFSGTVLDISGNVITITDGKFTAKIKTSSPQPTTEAQLVVWAKAACGGVPDVQVTVNGQSGTITAFQASEPVCGTAGTANFSLPPGDYTWKAYCGGDSAEGSVTLVAGNCTRAEVIFGSTPGTTCRVSKIASYDLSSGGAMGAITSFFNSANLINKITVFDSSTSTLLNQFAVSYSGIQVNVDAQQYFVLEPGARIFEFHGYLDPSDNTSPEVIVTYQYDASGFMSQAQLALKSAPTVPVLGEMFTWTGDNLTKIVIQQAGTSARTEIDYEYDLSKQARGFLAFFPNAEIQTFQTAISFGRNSTNVVSKSTITDFDASGTATGTTVSDFANYVIDANGYVTSFSITGGGSIYGTDIRYVLSYKCL